MELGLPSFWLKFILFLSVQKFSHENNTTSCKQQFLKRVIPANLLPSNLRFMIYYSSFGLPVPDFVDDRLFCLEEAGSKINLAPCNHKNDSQKWFQIQNSILNVGSGRTIVVGPGDSIVANGKSSFLQA